MVRLPRPVLLGAAAAALAAVAASAMAQPAVVHRAPGGYYGDPMMLLRMPQVQEELQLVDEQKAKLKEISEELQKQTREQWSGLRDLPPEQRRAKYAELREKAAARAEEARKKIEALLLPHQTNRLRQIALQLRMRWRGVGGIVDDAEMAELLGLTAKQKEQLQKIAEETRKKLQNLPREIMEEGKKKARDVLTPEQKKKLEEAVGAEFELRSSRPATPVPGRAGG